jgi:hypothetical protein
MDDKITISLAAHGPVELGNGVCLMKGDYLGFKLIRVTESETHVRYFVTLPAWSRHPDDVDVTSEVERGLLKPTQ